METRPFLDLPRSGENWFVPTGAGSFCLQCFENSLSKLEIVFFAGPTSISLRFYLLNGHAVKPVFEIVSHN